MYISEFEIMTRLVNLIKHRNLSSRTFKLQMIEKIMLFIQFWGLRKKIIDLLTINKMNYVMLILFHSLKTQFHLKLKCLRSDNGSQFLMSGFIKLKALFIIDLVLKPLNKMHCLAETSTHASLMFHV
jgi:hypothetical protein